MRPRRGCAGAVAHFGIPRDRVFTDSGVPGEDAARFRDPVPGDGAAWPVDERVAPYGVHLLVEKPFAASLAEADRMIAACARHRAELAINWPLRWYAVPCHRQRLVRRGRDRRVAGSPLLRRQPRAALAHGGQVETRRDAASDEAQSWFYKRTLGGGSLLDYLGYGTTLGTWYHGGRKPARGHLREDRPPGLEVDEHSVTVARYACGLSQVRDALGHVHRSLDAPAAAEVRLRASTARAGTIASYDYEAVRAHRGSNLPRGS